MKNIGNNMNDLGGNFIKGDMYRILNDNKPSSNTFFKNTLSGSINKKIASSKSTSTIKSFSSPIQKSSSSSTRNSSSSSYSSSTRNSSRGSSTTFADKINNKKSNTQPTSYPIRDTGRTNNTSQNSTRTVNTNSDSMRDRISNNVQTNSVKFDSSKIKTPAGIDFLNIPVVNVKGGATNLGMHGNSRNSSTVSYDLNEDATSRGKIVTAIDNSAGKKFKNVMPNSLGTQSNPETKKEKKKTLFNKIKSLFFPKKSKPISMVNKINTSKKVDIADIKPLHNNFYEIPTPSAVPLENKLESITGRTSNNNYTDYDVDKLASLIYRETGGSFRNSGESEEWFAFLNTAAVAMNNQARSGRGDTVGDRICSLSNNVYAGLSDYANTDFDTVTAGATEEQKEKVRNAAKMVLSGQYTLPSNMYLQASEGIVNRYGNTWNVHTPTSGGMNVHIGYEGDSASTTDLYGNTVATDIDSYRNEAEAIRQAIESTNDNANNYLNYIDPNDIRQL